MLQNSRVLRYFGIVLVGCGMVATNKLFAESLEHHALLDLM